MRRGIFEFAPLKISCRIKLSGRSCRLRVELNCSQVFERSNWVYPRCQVSENVRLRASDVLSQDDSGKY